MQRPEIENRSYKVPHKKRNYRKGRERRGKQKKLKKKILPKFVPTERSRQNKQLPRGKGAGEKNEEKKRQDTEAKQRTGIKANEEQSHG